MITDGPYKTYFGHEHFQNERATMSENDKLVLAIRGHLLSWMQNHNKTSVDMWFVFRCTNLFIDDKEIDHENSVFERCGEKIFLRELRRCNHSYYQMNRYKKFIYRLRYE